MLIKNRTRETIQTTVFCFFLKSKRGHLSGFCTWPFNVFIDILSNTKNCMEVNPFTAVSKIKRRQSSFKTMTLTINENIIAR